MTNLALTPEFFKVRMQEVFDRQAATALRLRSSTADERIAKIRKLRDAVIAHTEDCYHAAYADFKSHLAKSIWLKSCLFALKPMMRFASSKNG